MATKKSINKQVSSQYTKSKKYTYSWLEDGEGALDYIISDRNTSLNFDVGTDLSLDGATPAETVTFVDGSNNAYLKSIAVGYVKVEKNTDGTQEIKEYKFAAPKAISVNGVDAGAVYGGAVVTTNVNYTSIYYTTGSSSRYENVDAIVEGGANIAINTAKITSVYGGGAGYGSELNGDVKLTFTGTNTISNVFGGGQKGAVVNGNVSIDIDRRGVTGGRIGTVYGGGDNADVNGDVSITVHGVNALGIGTLDGKGKGKNAHVSGTSTLTIADYSGKFTTTIKNFDKIIFTSGTAVTLTQSQQKSIQSAEYQFIIDEASVNQPNAMLTWNKNIDTAKFYVTIDSDFASIADDAFTTTIYSSSYLTQAAFDKAGMKVYDEAGNEITSGYTLSFVADVDSKGKAKTKGGSVVLSFAGTKTVFTADSEDTELTAADDKVSVKGDTVRASLDTKGGDDTVTVQSGTLMAGDIALGEGENTLRVQGDAEMTGSIIVDKNSTNKIYVNGTISQIEGGDKSTNNIVYINTPNAVGYFNNEGRVTGDRYDESGDYEVDAVGNEAHFVPQVLAFSSESNDTVVLSSVVDDLAGIDFAKGADTLVVNGDLNFAVTYLDGEDVIVANQNGININANDLKLAGTQNVFVVANGVKANIKSAAVGSFMAQYDGIYLSQNAMAVINDTAVVSSYVGDIDLTGIKDGLLVTAVRTVNPEEDATLYSRIVEPGYYTAGDGVNATIKAAGNTITLNADADVNGTIIGADEVEFKGTAGGEKLFFQNTDGETTTLSVAKDAIATVGSIDGLVVEGKNDIVTDVEAFEADVKKLDLGNDAQVYEAAYDRTIVGNVTKATTFTGKVAFTGRVAAPITLENAKAFFSANLAEHDLDMKDITFVGENKIAVNGTQTLNNKKLKFAEGANVSFNVLDNAKLAIDGLVNGETYNANITEVALGTNSRFAYGDTLETASWERTFGAGDLSTDDSQDKNIIIRAGSKFEDGIDFTGDENERNITLGEGVEVTALEHNNANAIVLGSGKVALTIGTGLIDGQIDAGTNGGETTVTLNGTTINTTYGKTTAVTLDNADTLVADAAKINGGIAGGKIVEIKNGTNVAGVVKADGEIADGEGAFITDSTVAVVQGEATVYGATTLGKIEDGRVVLDGAKATINEIVGDTQTLEITNGATVAGDAITANSKSSTIKIAEAAAQAIVQNGANDETAGDATVEVVLEGNAASVGAVTQQAAEDEVLANANVFAGRVIEQKYDENEDVEKYPTALEPIGTDEAPITIARTTGAVAQTATANDFEGGVKIDADGTYAANLHKPAQVVVDKVAAEYGAIAQEGTTNTVNAGFDYLANGESDVKIQGASAMKLGDVTQVTKVAGDQGVFSNTVDVEINAAEDAESNLALGGDVTVELGKIDQTAFAANNKVYLATTAAADDAAKQASLAAAEKITVDAIDMKAYKGENELNILGNTEVKGDVSVGGVLEGTKYEKYTWGDKAANLNTVNIDADTAKVSGNVGLVGLTNKLTLTNDSFYTGDATERTVGQKITLAGKDNTIDLDAGVKMDNITLADITDYDKVGKDGQDLPDFSRSISADYKNTLILRGKVTSLELEQQNSSDTIKVYGGAIEGNVKTNNGNDAIYLGNVGLATDDNGIEVKADVMGDSTIGGNVVMGTKGDAEGSNAITMKAFDVKDEDGISIAAHNVAIKGSVEMYAGKNGDVAASNELSLAGAGFHDAKGYALGGTATIGGAVTMDAAVSFDKDGKGEGANAITMGPASVINGDVTMTAFASNAINVEASQEVAVADKSAKIYAEIAGKVDMAADQNTIAVKGAENGHAEKVAAGAGAYMNGISMTNVYADGENKYLTGDAATNTITVGADAVGSELIVGKSVAELADVAMGSVEFKKAGAADANYVLDAVEVAERGHDLVTYHDDQEVAVKSITQKNTIDVTGRFAAKDVKMTAASNEIRVYGDGNLGKNLTDDESKATDEVRTALFTAASIVQTGVVSNEITAVGENSVAHYGDVDADGNKIVTAELQSVDFTTGDIQQIQYSVDENTATNNTIHLGGLSMGQALTYIGNSLEDGGINPMEYTGALNTNDSIIATTGDITQLGKGDNEISVGSWVDVTSQRVGAPQSSTGKINQGELDENGAAKTLNGNNFVYLGTANTKSVTQVAEGNNYLLAQAFYQSNVDKWSKKTDDDGLSFEDPVYVAGAIEGDITQVSTKKVSVDEVKGVIADIKENGFSGRYDDIVQAVLVNGVGTVGYNVTGKISQTGDSNVTVFTGGLGVDIDSDASGSGILSAVSDISVGKKDVGFVMNNGEAGYYQENVNVSLGALAQDGRLNAAVLGNAKVEGGIEQKNADLLNVAVAYNQSVSDALNKGAGDVCEYDHDDPSTTDVVETLTHANDTVVENADFNTQSIGDVKQTAVAADPEDEIVALANDTKAFGATVGDLIGSNVLAAVNANVGDVTQNGVAVNAAAVINNITADGLSTKGLFSSGGIAAGTVTKMTTYTGEIDDNLNPVTKVAEYEVMNQVNVGDTLQEGAVNVDILQGVKAGTITQTQSGSTGLFGNDDEQYANVIRVMPSYVKKVDESGKSYSSDVVKEVVTQMEWKDNKEVQSLLAVGENQRITNEVGALTQTTDWAGDYDVAKGNVITLQNTNIKGDVIQKATKENAYVYNDFYAETDEQYFVDVVDIKDEKGNVTDTEAVEYYRTTLGEFTGSLTQKGYENDATLYDTTMVASENGLGTISQTADYITAKDTHGVVIGEKAGSNDLDVEGSIDYEQDGAKKAGYEAKANVVDVGAVTQTVNNAGDVKYVLDGEDEGLESYNDAYFWLANVKGDITQSITYGSNQIEIESDDPDWNEDGEGQVPAKASVYAQLTAENMYQAGTANNIDVECVTMKSAEQTATGLAGYDGTEDGHGVVRNDFYSRGDIFRAEFPLFDEEEEGGEEESEAKILDKSVVKSTLVGEKNEDGTVSDIYTTSKIDSITQKVVWENVATGDDGKVYYKYDYVGDYDLYFNEARNLIGNYSTSVDRVIQSGEGWTRNTYDFGGADINTYSENEEKGTVTVEKTEYVNILGSLSQTGVSNVAKVYDALSVGTIEQNARSANVILTKETVDESVTTKYDFIGMLDGDGLNTPDVNENYLQLQRIDSVASVNQTATSEAYEYSYTKQVGDGEPDTKPGEAVTWMSNEIDAEDVTVGQVTQIVKDVDGAEKSVASGDNYLEATNSNFFETVTEELPEGPVEKIAGGITQSTVDGYNEIYFTTQADDGFDFRHLYDGEKIDEGEEVVLSDLYRVGAISQTAIGNIVSSVNNYYNYYGSNDTPVIDTLPGQFGYNFAAAMAVESISQKAVAFEDGDDVENSIMLVNDVEMSSADKQKMYIALNYMSSSYGAYELPLMVVDYLDVQGADYTKGAEVKSITQEAQILAADKDGYFATENSGWNQSSTFWYNVGDVKQFGSVLPAAAEETPSADYGLVVNDFGFLGSYDIVTLDSGAKTYEVSNTLGSLEQFGADNVATVAMAEEAGDFNQTAVAVLTVETETGDSGTTITKGSSGAENMLALFGIEKAGNVVQTVTGLAYDEEVTVNGVVSEEDSGSAVAATANKLSVISANVESIVQSGAAMNAISVGDIDHSMKADEYEIDGSTIGAIEQTATYAGTGHEKLEHAYGSEGTDTNAEFATIANTIEVNSVYHLDWTEVEEITADTPFDSIASIKQSAIGEYVKAVAKSTDGELEDEGESEEEVVAKDIRGFNQVVLKSANVLGLIDQDAAGFEAQNDIKSYGETLNSTAPTSVGGLDYTNGSYLNSLGDIKQYLNSSIDKAGWEKEGKFAASNTLYINNTNLGNVAQEGADVTYSYNYADISNNLMGYETRGIDEATSYSVGTNLKASVGSFTQKGFENYANIAGAAIAGDLYVYAKGIFTETEEGQDWAFGKNTIYLDNVDVQNITATTQKGTVTIDGKQYVNAAADTDLNLDGVTVNDVKTGFGNDTITIDSDSGDESFITGTIDMGDNTWTISPKVAGEGYDMLLGKDTLNVDVAYVDISKASIDNVEVFNVVNGADNVSTVIIQAKSIDAEAINNVSGSGKGRVEASNIEVKSLSGIQVLAGLNDATTKDTLTLEGTLGTIQVNDFDEVTFANGATGENITWFDTAGTSETQGTIKFDLTNVISEDDTATAIVKENEFLLGKFTDTYGKSDVTFKYGDNEYTYQTSGSVNEGYWTSDTDTTHKFSYASSSGTVTYANA